MGVGLHLALNARRPAPQNQVARMPIRRRVLARLIHKAQLQTNDDRLEIVDVTVAHPPRNVSPPVAYK